MCSSLIPGPFVWIGDLLESKKDKDAKAEKAKDFMTHCNWALSAFLMEVDAEHLKKDTDLKSIQLRLGGEPSENDIKNAEAVARQLQGLKKLQNEIGESLTKLTLSLKVPGQYWDIFGTLVLTETNSYVQQHSNRFAVYTSADFPRNLRELHDNLHKTHHVIRGDIGQEILPIYDEDFDRTDVYPHKTAKWRRGQIHHEILSYTTPLVGVLYSVARLVIIAVAFSSLRAMPAGVYEATWTKYLPKLD